MAGMNKFLKIFITFIIIFLGVSVVTAQKLRVSIYVIGGEASGDNKVLASKMAQAINKSSAYTATERTADFLKQLGKEQAGRKDDASIVKLAKQEDSDYMCVAEISTTQNADFVTARLIDVNTGSVVASSGDGKRIEDLPSLMKIAETVAKQLLAGLGKASTAADLASKSGFSGDKGKVAVYVTGVGDPSDHKVITSKLMDAIARSNKYTTVERTDDFLAQLRKENGLVADTSSLDDGQIAGLGAGADVDFVCVADVSEVRGGYFLSVRIVDVNNADVKASADDAIDFDDINSLMRVAYAVAEKLVTVHPGRAVISGKATNTCPDLNVTLSATADDAVSFKWYKDKQIIRGASENTYSATQSGTYYAVGVNQFGDGPMSDVKEIEIKFCKIEMTNFSPGTFTMGCSDKGAEGVECERDEKPAHQVTVGGFGISKYEITQAQWQTIMGYNPSYFKGDNLPVENVSWDEIQIFIRKLSQLFKEKYRLPTEAEWEFAAKGGTKNQTFLYSGSDIENEVAWCDINSEGKTHPVGTKKASAGVWDMSGNVWEWCNDYYEPYTNTAQTDPQGAKFAENRVIRGGAWNKGSACRVTYRYYRLSGYRDNTIGFRLVLPLETKVKTEDPKKSRDRRR